jgi:hypothetical protein
MNTNAYGAMRPFSINRYRFHYCRSTSNGVKPYGMKCPNRAKKAGKQNLWEGTQNGDVLDSKHM